MVAVRAKTGTGQKASLKARLHAWWEGYAEPPSDAADDASALNHASEEENSTRAELDIDLEEARHWSPERLQAAQRIFDPGVIRPESETYIQNLIAPLGMDETMSVVLCGARVGTVARFVAESAGAWVTAFETKTILAEEATRLSKAAGLTKKAAIEAGSIENGGIRDQTCDAVICCEAFYATVEKTPAFQAVARALKSTGQLLLTDFVRIGQQESSPDIEIWSANESATPQLLTVEELTGQLKEVGFDVRVAEDISAEYCREIAHALQLFSDSMKINPIAEDLKPWVLWEVDYWARCAEVLQGDDLALYRVHAIVKRNGGPTLDGAFAKH